MKAVSTVALLAISASIAHANTTRVGTWTPSEAQVAMLERQMIGKTPMPLPLAHRRYGGIMSNGRREIIAQYVWRGQAAAGLEIVSDGLAKRAFDGGCGVYNLTYDVEDRKVLQEGCGGR